MANSGRVCGRGATSRCKNPLLSPSNFTQGHSMTIEWFVTNVTAVPSPDTAEGAILKTILVVFWPSQAVFAVGEPLCEAGTPLEP